MYRLIFVVTRFGWLPFTGLIYYFWWEIIFLLFASLVFAPTFSGTQLGGKTRSVYNLSIPFCVLKHVKLLLFYGILQLKSVARSVNLLKPKIYIMYRQL